MQQTLRNTECISSVTVSFIEPFEFFTTFFSTCSGKESGERRKHQYIPKVLIILIQPALALHSLNFQSVPGDLVLIFLVAFTWEVLSKFLHLVNELSMKKSTTFCYRVLELYIKLSRFQDTCMNHLSNPTESTFQIFPEQVKEITSRTFNRGNSQTL